MTSLLCSALSPKALEELRLNASTDMTMVSDCSGQANVHGDFLKLPLYDDLLSRRWNSLIDVALVECLV